MNVPVLVYHAVAARPPAGLERWTVSPREFEQHLEAIAESGRMPLTIGELARCLRGERRLDRDAVAITFDDGYADTRDAAHRLLRRNISSTVYVATGWLGRARHAVRRRGRAARRPRWGADRLARDHASASRRAAPRGWTRRSRGSRRALHALTGAKVDSFAYPHGSYDRRVRAAVVGAGYRSAAAVKNAMSHLADDPFAIARVTVVAGTSAERLAGILRGEDVPIAWRRERVRTRAFRTLRRARRQLRERGPTAHR